MLCVLFFFFFFQAEDGIRDLVRSRGLGDVYKRQNVKREAGNWIVPCRHCGEVNVRGEFNPLSLT